MNLIDNKTRTFDGKLITNCQFDKLSSPEDVVRIVKVFESCGMKIESLTAFEFGDYDDDKKIITYTDMKKIEQLIEDFKNVNVENYNMRGTYNNTNFISTIYPQTNSLAIRYNQQLQHEMDESIHKISR